MVAFLEICPAYYNTLPEGLATYVIVGTPNSIIERYSTSELWCWIKFLHWQLGSAVHISYSLLL